MKINSYKSLFYLATLSNQVKVEEIVWRHLVDFLQRLKLRFFGSKKERGYFVAMVIWFMKPNKFIRLN